MKNEETPSRNKLKLICNSFISIIFLVGIVLLLISFLIPNNGNSVLIDLLTKILSALGQTLIGSGVISILFSFRDVRDYSLGLIKDLLVDCRYMDTLKSNQLEKIHDSCHERLHYHDVDLNKKEWGFLSEKCVEVFRVPCCKDWREDIECSIIDNEIVKKFDLKYELINPLKEGIGIADVEQRYNLYIPPNKKKEDCVILKKFIIKIDDKDFDVKPYINYADDNLKRYNTLVCVKSDELNLKQVQFKNHLSVHLVLITKVQMSDPSYTNRLRYPTLNFRIDFTCNDDRIGMNPQFFGGFIKKDGFDMNVGQNHSFIECKNKLMLPGSGASIVLNINNKKNSKLKKN